MKSIMISIQPKWVEKICSCKKTIEVRKTRPTIETPFKCYIYCTKGQVYGAAVGGVETWKGIAEDEDLQKVFELNPTLMQYNGKVIGEFVCDKIDIYVGRYENKDYWDLSVKEWEELKKKSCLTIPQILEYTGDSPCCYGWHISDLVIYDKPKELSEFRKICHYNLSFCLGENCEYWGYSGCENFLTRPPQSWCYVESLGE